jgi:hypothetical protein
MWTEKKKKKNRAQDRQILRPGGVSDDKAGTARPTLPVSAGRILFFPFPEYFPFEKGG